LSDTETYEPERYIASEHCKSQPGRQERQRERAQQAQLPTGSRRQGREAEV